MYKACHATGTGKEDEVAYLCPDVSVWHEWYFVPNEVDSMQFNSNLNVDLTAFCKFTGMNDSLYFSV
jgi:hypothetical protein